MNGMLYVGRKLACAAASIAVLVACSAGDDERTCRSDSDCHPLERDCAENVCRAERCTVEDLPAGARPRTSGTTLTCFKRECDGSGSIRLAVDVTNAPAPSFTCSRPQCTPDGQVEHVFDPSRRPPDPFKGDCKSPQCAPDESTREENDDADAPEPAACKTSSCADGAVVTGNVPRGEKCLGYGAVCNGTGACKECEPADASCTDPGPAKDASSAAAALDFGAMSRCDFSGKFLCGTLPGTGQRRHFRFAYDASGSGCVFDPVIRVVGSQAVRLCAHFAAPAMPCAFGAPAQQDGMNGCCIDGADVELGAPPEGTWTSGVMTVESLAAGCTSYSVDLHL